MRTVLLLAALGCARPALADDELTPQKAAKIDRETAKALKAVDKKYGDKKSSELTREERRAVIEERAAAEREVLQKNDTDAKTFTRYSARQTKEERAATKQAGEALEANERAAAAAEAAAQEKAGGPKEITIQRGGGDNNPIVMEEKEGAPPIVERGLPQEAQDDQGAAAGATVTDSTTEQAPAKGKGKGKQK